MAAGIRVKLDADDSQTPGWKFSEYEMRGVPLRLEIGPKDIEKASVFAARRDTRAKQSLPMDGLAASRQGAARRDSGSAAGRARAYPREPHVGDHQLRRVQEHHGRPAGLRAVAVVRIGECEADIKAETQATIRNIPFGFEQAPGVPCIKCNGPAVVTAWFAKAY